jgi:hypothetical protein
MLQELRYDFTTIWLCVCGHSQGAHQADPKLAGCGFCHCLTFAADHAERERQLQVAAPLPGGPREIRALINSKQPPRSRQQPVITRH